MRSYWLALNHVKGIGAVRFRLLLEKFGSAEAAWKASRRDLEAAGLDKRSLASLLKQRDRIDPAAVVEKVERTGARVLTWEDAEYPQLLRTLPDSPPVLYVKGAITEADDWSVAVVGTRKATSYGKTIAAQLADGLARNGVTVISGLAVGIDTAAHKGTLEAGGRTIAVLGSGIDRIYPSQNRGLAEEIAESGAVITEFPPGTRPHGSNFPARNRIISGLSLGVVVAEAPESSGALLTADAALEQGRDVFAVPGYALAASSRGANRLIQQGAKLVMDVEDILSELNLVMATPPPTRPASPKRAAAKKTQQPVTAAKPAAAVQVANAAQSETETALLEALAAGGPVHVDELRRISGLPIAEVTAALTLLELRGIVEQHTGMYYTLAPVRPGGYLVD